MKLRSSKLLVSGLLVWILFLAYGDMQLHIRNGYHHMQYRHCTIKNYPDFCSFVNRHYVRWVSKDNGEFGLGFGYLLKPNVGDTFKLRLKNHKNFHNYANPTIIIAAK